ncbi:hypothetical protein BDV97DRAFT_364692 [Delphinella strobiligena]|nr:hypothetical protein BDV97DRAFT_364692 [Delphinella strobiligena]
MLISAIDTSRTRTLISEGNDGLSEESPPSSDPCQTTTMTLEGADPPPSDSSRTTAMTPDGLDGLSEESPPPYTKSVPPSQAVGTEAVPTKCDIERFRRFMAFRLAVAYGLESALPSLDRPTEEDKELFARLASDSFRLLHDEKIHKSARKVDKLDTDIYEHILWPADALLLPRGMSIG